MAPGHGRGQPASRDRVRARAAQRPHRGRGGDGQTGARPPFGAAGKDWRCQKQGPAAGAHVRLAEAGPVSHASARPPHVVVPAPGRLRPRSRPGSGARRRAAASPPPERSLRAALRGPAEAPRTSSEAPPPCAACSTRGVRHAARPASRSSRGARGPVWTRAAPRGTGSPGAHAVVLARRARTRGAGPRSRVVASVKPADISPDAPAGPGGS